MHARDEPSPLARHAIGAMLRHGVHGLRAYPGLFACLYLVQLAISGGAAAIMGVLMSGAWGKSETLTRAASGDAAALAFLLRDGPHVIAALFWLLAGAVALYALLSWYLAGGLNAVLLSRPADRRDTARVFGAGGAFTFLAYLRLGLLSLVPYAIIAASAGIGLSAVKERLQYALTMGDVLGALVLALAPALALWWLHGSAVRYARIALSQRGLRAQRMAAARALLRAYRLVLTRPQPLLHVLLYALWFLAVSALFAAITWSVPAAGAAGALALFALRQITALLRSAGAFALAGGQVAFAARPAIPDAPAPEPTDPPA